MKTPTRVLALVIVALSWQTARADVPPEVTAAAAAAQIPGLKLLAVASGIEAAPEGVGYRLRDTTLGEASIFKAADGKWRGSLVLKTPSSLKLPGFDAVGTLNVAGVTLIFSDSAATLTVAELPHSVTYSPAWDMAMLQLRPGVNVFATASVSGGVFGQLQSAVGASGPITVVGSFGEALVQKLLGQSSEDDAQATLTVKLPGVSNGNRVFDLHIDGFELTATKTAAGVSFAGAIHGVALKFVNAKVPSFDGTITVTRSGGTSTVELKADKPYSRSNLFGLPGVSLNTIGVAAKMSNVAGVKSVAFGVSVSVDLPGAANITGFLMMHSSGHGALFLDVQNLDVAKLVGKTLPFSLVLPRAVVALSTGNLGELGVGTMPAPAADMLTGLGLKSDSKVKIPLGLAFFAQLKVGSGAASAELKKLSKVGVNIDLIIGGSVALSSTPSFSLFAQLPSIPTPPDPIGKFMKFNSVSLFMNLSSDGGVPVVSAGLDGSLSLNLPTSATTLSWVEYGGKASFSFGGTAGGALQLSAHLKSDWNSPFGLAGVAFLKDTGASFQADATGATRVMMDGQVRFEDGRPNDPSDDLVFKLGGGINVLFSTGIPSVKGLALRIEASEVALLTPVKVGQTILRSAAGLAGSLTDASGVGLPQAVKDGLNTAKNANLVGLVQNLIPNVSPLKEMMALKLKGNPATPGSNVLFYLATPGMTDPDFPDFNDVGIKFRGSLYNGDKYLAGVDSYLTLNQGFQLQGSVADFSIGPLSLSKAAIDIGAGIPVLQPDAPPRFRVSGTATLGGVTLASVDVDLSTSKIAAAGEVNLGLCPNKLVSAPRPGALVALYSPFQSSFIFMDPKGVVQAQGLPNPLDLPASYTYQQFRVVDAGNGNIGLVNETHGRIMRMQSGGQIDGIPGNGVSESTAFRVVPGPRTSNRNLFSLYNAAAKRFVRVTNGNAVDGNGGVIPGALLPPAWDWERIEVVELQPGQGAPCGNWGLSASLAGSITGPMSFSIKGHAKLVLPRVGFVELPALDTGEFKLESPDGVGFNQDLTWEKATFHVGGHFKSLTDWSLDGNAAPGTGNKDFSIGKWTVASMNISSGSLSLSLGPNRFRVHAAVHASIDIKALKPFAGKSYGLDFDTDLPPDLRIRTTISVPDPEATCETGHDKPCPTLKEPWAWCHYTTQDACPFTKNRDLAIDYRIFP